MKEVGARVRCRAMRKEGANIVVSDSGVSLTVSPRTLWSFDWDDVDRIQAYKLDLITTDDVCLEFVAKGLSYTVDEETPGWDSLLQTLAQRFALAESWAEIITDPPFATNRSVLWDRRVTDALAHAAQIADASPRIVVKPATLEDWNNMLALVRGMFGGVEVTSDGKKLQHGLTSRHFHGKHRATINFRTGGIDVSGSCLDESQIELGIAGSDPAAYRRLVVAIETFLGR